MNLFLKWCDEHGKGVIRSLAPFAYSQYMQDLCVLSRAYKFEGYFVEVGASNGVKLSNTFLLERMFGWKGLLVEANPQIHDELRRNRPGVLIDTRGAYNRSGRVEFLMVDEPKIGFPVSSYELSGIAETNSTDDWAYDVRKLNSSSFEIEVDTMTNILLLHNVPDRFDYLSIDVEGAEIQVLEGLDFNTHRPSLITIEHNRRPVRAEILRRLAREGYENVHPESSGKDDWFVFVGS
jgi:FkbM family methyltransferase